MVIQSGLYNSESECVYNTLLFYRSMQIIIVLFFKTRHIHLINFTLLNLI